MSTLLAYFPECGKMVPSHQDGEVPAGGGLETLSITTLPEHAFRRGAPLSRSVPVPE